MPVNNVNEVKDLLDQGWKIYYHTRNKRWYLRRKDKRKIIAKELNDFCEKMHKETAVRAGEIQKKRMKGESIKKIAEDTGVSERTVYNALGRDPEELIRPRKRRGEMQEACPEEEDFYSPIRRILKDGWIIFCDKCGGEVRGFSPEDIDYLIEYQYAVLNCPYCCDDALGFHQYEHKIWIYLRDIFAAFVQGRKSINCRSRIFHDITP